MPDELILLSVAVPADEAEYAADVLWSSGAQAIEERSAAAHVELVTDFGAHPLERWTAIVAAHPAAAQWGVRTLAVSSTVADTWREHAQTTNVGNVRIVPAWQSIETGPRDIVIDPGGAFGMGDHPTTRATLERALSLNGSNALDLGCGSGVLAIALAKFCGVRCVAIDIAPAAVEATLQNAALNHVADMIVIEQGDVRSVRGTYDIVLANILAPVLLSDAADIALRVTTGGTLVLSGFTATRLNDVESAYQALGLVRTGLTEIDGWFALQMQRVEENREVE